ncbi:hypothetical protein GUITHDRAFT_160893 [Guillardia theta CCMP2712]|uniref:Uncharacterized protein n=1 Tax=Guillardia theta (strain CCMP2712) TaxID=905079 RepID=L1JZM6_GUITC|nr:hypothetical protein GUITHDRAFT_160893 [Guillardia theta CCMP2712]EKX53660.1 hypothetical protein GUITHDRAFT_160893 [Guillardia theta CCMP2712]|eukprot:XP_005840640.1 hypothetical protein GUITHDRAFT_160893 [Guillardia theta CCMP2712]
MGGGSSLLLHTLVSWFVCRSLAAPTARSWSSESGSENLVAGRRGGSVVATAELEEHHPSDAIDGVLSEDNGWSSLAHGLRKPRIIFILPQDSVVNEIVLFSGYGRNDRRIVSCRLWYWPAGNHNALQEYLFSSSRMMNGDFQGWEELDRFTVTSTGVVPLANTFFARSHRYVFSGMPEIRLLIHKIDLRAIALQVDLVDNDSHKFILNEFVVLGNKKLTFSEQLQRSNPWKERGQHQSCIDMRSFFHLVEERNMSLRETLRSMTEGRWVRSRSSNSVGEYRCKIRRNENCEHHHPLSWASDIQVPSFQRVQTGSEWKDFAVPESFLHLCGGNLRYQNPEACSGAIAMSKSACGGSVQVHFVEAWHRQHITSAMSAIADVSLASSERAHDLFVIDGCGLHFILGGDGLRAGFDGYIPDLLDAFKSAKSARDQHLETIFIKSLIEPYTTKRPENVINNWNIASMNQAAIECIQHVLVHGAASCPDDTSMEDSNIPAAEENEGILILDSWRMAGRAAGSDR